MPALQIAPRLPEICKLFGVGQRLGNRSRPHCSEIWRCSLNVADINLLVDRAILSYAVYSVQNCKYRAEYFGSGTIDCLAWTFMKARRPLYAMEMNSLLWA
jgi:hypothetical protein